LAPSDAGTHASRALAWHARIAAVVPALVRAAAAPGPVAGGLVPAADDGGALPAPASFRGVASSSESGGEADVRFLYAALASAALTGLSLADVGIPPAGAAAYIASCQSYEGGFGLRPGGTEAHGGSTYCAVASLALLQRAARAAAAGGSDGGAAPSPWAGVDVPLLARWLALRQVSAATAGDDAVGAGGVSGRAGKDADVCYSFWIGASMAIVSGADGPGGGGGGVPSPFAPVCGPLLSFLAQAEAGGSGGYGKEAGDPPDPFHSHYALYGAARAGAGGPVRAGVPLEPVLGLTGDAALRWRTGGAPRTA
jgi:prenyltransferase beta subunit